MRLRLHLEFVRFHPYLKDSGADVVLPLLPVRLNYVSWLLEKSVYLREALRRRSS